MKKRAVAIILAVLMAAFSAGCNKGDADVSAYITLGEYKGLQAETTDAQVTEEEIQAKIKTDMKDVAKTEEIKDGAVENGDTVNLDFVGTMDGKEFDNGSAKGADLVIGSGQFIDGFEEQLIGFKTGDKKTITVTFPDPYKNNPEFSGKDADFAVTINKITRTTYPELTDEIAAKISEEKTVEAYKAAVKESLEAQKKAEADNTKKNTLWETAMKNASIKSYPQSEVEDYANRMISYYKDAAEKAGVAFSEYAQNYMGITEEDFTIEANETAKQWVGYHLLARAIAQQEGLSVSEEEYTQNLQELVTAGQADSFEELEAVYGKEIWMGRMLITKVIEFIDENSVES